MINRCTDTAVTHRRDLGIAAAAWIPPRLLAVAAIAAAGLRGAGKLSAAAIGLPLPALLLYALGGADHGVKTDADGGLLFLDHGRRPGFPTALLRSLLFSLPILC